jgi:glycosyltransferase involved in cell wall biosynthesis
VRILFIDLEREWRGGQNQGLLALRGFRAAGHEAHLVAIEGGALADRAEREAIPVHRIAAGTKRLAATREVRRLLRKESFEVVHANEPHALTAAWLAGAHKQGALVASRRIALPLKPNALALARYRSARKIVAVSEFVAQSVRASGIAKERVEVVYDGVELPALPTSVERAEARKSWGVDDDEILLGCVGYLLPEKGQRYGIEALKILLSNFPKSRLLLAGDGPSRAELDRLVKDLQLENLVTFAGHVDDVASVYRALDVFVFPSMAEPLGSSLLAAMAWGLAVVALESGGVPEVVGHGHDGLLVNPGRKEEAGEAIANAVADLLRKPQLAGALGAAARKTIEERFTAERMVRKTLQVYESVR